MNAHDMLPTELGSVAADGLRDILRRAVGDANIVTQVEGQSSVTWGALSESGWDMLGVRDDGDGATLRDLAAVAKVWGSFMLPLPYLETVLARRHSAAAADHEGPVTFSVPLATLPDARGYVPYAGFEGIGVATSLGGSGEDSIVSDIAGEPDALDLAANGVETDVVTVFSGEAAREVAVVVAASAVGAADRMLGDAVAYAKERHQFGKPIGVHQAVKHALANGLIALEQADTAVIWASLHDEEAFRGSARAIESAIEIAQIAIQVHGGIGFTWELGLHYYLRHMMLGREIVAGLARG